MHRPPCLAEDGDDSGVIVACTDTPPPSAAMVTESDIEVIQSMIDISADRLEGLRTQCVTSAELTQQEIRSLETKLVKMFTEMLVTKARLAAEGRQQQHSSRGSGGPPVSPSSAELKQWLRVVGEQTRAIYTYG